MSSRLEAFSNRIQGLLEMQIFTAGQAVKCWTFLTKSVCSPLYSSKSSMKKQNLEDKAVSLQRLSNANRTSRHVNCGSVPVSSFSNTTENFWG